MVPHDCKCILVVEDDEAIRQTIQDVLELEGYRTLSAANGAEGLQLLSMLPERPCVIILDMMMPEMNGWQFLDIQRSLDGLREIPVIVCSAYKESAKTVRPQAVVTKPIQLGALKSAVRALCA